MAKNYNVEEDDASVDRSNWHVNAPKNPSQANANDWLIESSKNPKWLGSRVEEPKPRERVALVTPEYDQREKLVRAVAAQGVIPHHQTGDPRPVSSIGEARIIIDYVIRSKRDAPPPQEVPLMTEDQETELTSWLKTGRV